MAPVLFPTLFVWVGGPGDPMDINVMDNPHGGAELLGRHCLSSSMTNICAFTHPTVTCRIFPVSAAGSILYLPPELNKWKAFNMHDPFLRGRRAFSWLLLEHKPSRISGLLLLQITQALLSPVPCLIHLPNSSELNHRISVSIKYILVQQMLCC